MTTLVKPRKVKAVITMVGGPKHLVTSQMQRFCDIVEDMVISHNYQFSERINCVIEWPEVAE